MGQLWYDARIEKRMGVVVSHSSIMHTRVFDIMRTRVFEVHELRDSR